MGKVRIDWIHESTSMTTRLDLNVPAGAAADAPVVILLHGNDGTVDDMSRPAKHPGMNYEHVKGWDLVRDRKWRPYPNVGYWSIGIDALIPVRGWEPFLQTMNVPTINYQQLDPLGRLVRPAAELRAILSAIEEAGRVNSSHPGLQGIRHRPIVLLAHSRGGLVARQALVDLKRQDSPVLERITTCITLHSPHQGTSLTNAARDLNEWLRSIGRIDMWLPFPLNGVADQVERDINKMIDWVLTQTGHPSFRDMEVGSATLKALAAEEPVPGIDFYTFGGTRPTLFNVRTWDFDAQSAIPQFHMPPFHWRTNYHPWVAVPPVDLGLPELTDRIGDILTTAKATRLPFSVHRDNYINHAQALWDPNLQEQVLSLLRAPTETAPLLVECVMPDSNDPGRSIDGFGVVDDFGRRRRMSLEEAVSYMEGPEPLRIAGREGIAELQLVRRQDRSSYLRSKPGRGGIPLGELPLCPPEAPKP